MTDELPGLRVHINDGRVAGTFDLPPADMQQISYGGRVMFVLIADVTNIRVADTKDGDTKATWTFKVADSAIVRDGDMQRHLADTLYMSMQDTIPGLEDAFREMGKPKFVGEYDDEGAFLGLKPLQERTTSGQGNDPTGPEGITRSVHPKAEVDDEEDDFPDLQLEDLTSGKGNDDSVQVVSVPPARTDSHLKGFLEDQDSREERLKTERATPSGRDPHLSNFLEDVRT